MAQFETWIDRQIREAQERGEFSNLRGEGKPIPGLTGVDDENWWIKSKLESEGVKAPLPTSLALRKEIADLQETLDDVRTERDARDIIEHLNGRILDTRRRQVDGPPILIRTVDVEATLATWRQRRRPSTR